MRKLLALLSLALVCISLSARDIRVFNDGWFFKKGPFTADAVLQTGILDGTWNLVKIPHTWNATDMQVGLVPFYAGEAYYRKLFTPEESLKGKRVFIRFEGVATVTEVYINNNPMSAKSDRNGNLNFGVNQAKSNYQHAGNHKGGYSAFSIELTKLLEYGKENEILVKVSNESRPDVIPINHTLFGVYGGIYRSVELIITENVNIAVTDYASPGIYISQENVTSKSADVSIKVKLENKNKDAQNITLLTSIYERDGKLKAKQEMPLTVLQQGRQAFVQKFNILKPHLWQGLEDPYLYKVVTQVIQNGSVIDEVVQPLGIRHYDLRAGDGMYLNGKKVPMYGVCRHQDWWKLGSALTKENHDTDLEIIKEIGATTIRLAHYQQSDYFYSKCDSIGFMVWAEIPFVNRVSTQESENAKQQMTELIRQSYNHPSIYVWGLHNEVYSPAEYTRSLTTALNDLAKSEDPYRYTVQVSGYNKIDHEVNNNADLQGINQYFGWYNGTLDSLQTWVNRVEREFKGYKVIFSEYGTEANIALQKEVVSNRGDCCGFDKDYNESFATRFHEEHWGVISKHPFLIGSYIWNTFDFATPMTAQGQVPSRNMKGLVTFDRKVKKDPFYWYKANWSKEPVLYLTQRRVVNRGNEITPVTVYSNIGIPQLFVNGLEIKGYRMGATGVHYIFENVKLKEGENIVEVKAQKNGKDYNDKIRWNYSEKYKNAINSAAPEVRLGEHVGL